MSIEEMVEQIQRSRSSPEARELLDRLLKAYEPLVRREAGKMMGDGYEDACQEARRAVLEAVWAYDPERGVFFGTYVKRRVWAAVRNLQRQQWRWSREGPWPLLGEEDEEMELPDPAPLEEPWIWEEWMQVLSSRERQCLEMHLLQGYTLREVAEHTGVSVETAKTWKKRALRKLRENLSP